MENGFFFETLNIFEKLDQTIDPNFSGTVNAWCAGGFAMSYWLGPCRITDDIDVIFSHRININNISIVYHGKNIFLDTSFNDTLSALQEDFPDRATYIKRIGHIAVYVLSPEDLAVMKISRWVDCDREDVVNLIKNDLIDQDVLKQIFDDALKIYIGNTQSLQYAFDDVITVIENIHGNQEMIPGYLQIYL